MLLKAGAKIDDRTLSGYTALMFTAHSSQNPEVIKVLLEAGADGKLKSSEGKTAYDYAQDNQWVKGTDAYSALKNASF